MDPDLFYDLPPKSTRTPWRVQLVCSACPVRSECLTDALHHRDQFGVWGGTTPLARRALERAQP
jgi:WhiB family redox-sensing transcriptional regulator